MTEKNKVLAELHGVRAEVICHSVWDVPANALIIKLPEAGNVLSSRDGYKRVKAVCNCYLPESLWPTFHSVPDKWPAYLQEVLARCRFLPGTILKIPSHRCLDIFN